MALAAEPRGAETLCQQAIAPFALQTATAVADCYLIGFAEAADAHVVTFDRGLAATAQLRTRFAPTQIYWPEAIGIMEILLSLSTTIDEPLELCVSMPINSLP